MMVAGVVVAGIASWVAAPWIAMARRGTVDQRTVASWRAEPPRALPTPLSEVIPAQRIPAETSAQQPA